MSRFSPSEAAFEGFRLTREKPSLILGVGVLEILVALVGGAIFFGLAGQQFMDLVSATMAHDTARIEVMQARMIGVQLAQFATLPVQIIIYSVIFAAIYRAVLRPSEGGWGYLRLGGDELRLLGLSVVLFLLAIVGVLVLIIGSVILMAAAQMAPTQARGPLHFLIVVAVWAVVAWIAVRLSLAAPMTFAERKLRIFESWRLTKGAFWSLLGMYLLTFVMAIVVSVLIGVVFAVVGIILALALGLGEVIKKFGEGGHLDFASLSPGLVAVGLLFLLAASFFNAFVRTIMYAPAAIAYRELIGGTDR